MENSIQIIKSENHMDIFVKKKTNKMREKWVG